MDAVRDNRVCGSIELVYHGQVNMATTVNVLIDAVPINLGMSTGAAGALAIVLVIYSYFIWRRDPDKIPPAGTLPA
jgi:hypothetical protein